MPATISIKIGDKYSSALSPNTISHGSVWTKDQTIADEEQRINNRWDSSLSQYLREIGTVKRISRDEEKELAGRIRKGDVQARARMIEANLRLVVKIARNYEGIGVHLQDLISEGNIGLMKAVEHYDPGKGAKLSSYSAYWIRQAIIQALANQSKDVRLPVYVAIRFNKMCRTAMRLEEGLGREPTGEELASEMGTSLTCIANTRGAHLQFHSLDAPINGETSTYAEQVPDEKAEAPYEQLENKMQLSMLQESIETLREREKTVLMLRFGLNETRPRTLEQVAVKMGITDERVRQIQNDAIKKLRRRFKKRDGTNPIHAAVKKAISYQFHASKKPKRDGFSAKGQDESSHDSRCLRKQEATEA